MSPTLPAPRRAAHHLTIVLSVVVLMSGCRRGESSATAGQSTVAASPTTSPAGVVQVVSVAPDTVTIRAGEPTMVIIRGSGFDATGNTVRLGPVTVTSVKASEGGTIIAFMVPERVPATGGAAPMLWVPGTYALTVENRRGVSRAVSVTVKEPQ